jgi:hypothetical protein
MLWKSSTRRNEMNIYTFREEAIIYTTVVADSEEEAWKKLDVDYITVPDNVNIDVLDCEIIEIEEKKDGNTLQG